MKRIDRGALHVLSMCVRACVLNLSKAAAAALSWYVKLTDSAELIHSSGQFGSALFRKGISKQPSNVCGWHMTIAIALHLHVVTHSHSC